MAPLVLLTRPRDAAEAFAAELAPLGWKSLIWPLTSVENRLSAPIDPSGLGALAFTSARGVEALGPLDETLARLPAFCVGPKTSAAARRAGFRKVFDANGDAKALTEAFRARGDIVRGRVLHVRGAHAGASFADALRDVGFHAEEIIAYEAVAAETRPAEVDAALEGGTLSKAAFFSPRAGAIFADLTQGAVRDGLKAVEAVAISAAAAQPLRSIGFKAIIVADRPNGAAMRAAICGGA